MREGWQRAWLDRRAFKSQTSKERDSAARHTSPRPATELHATIGGLNQPSPSVPKLTLTPTMALVERMKMEDVSIPAALADGLFSFCFSFLCVLFLCSVLSLSPPPQPPLPTLGRLPWQRRHFRLRAVFCPRPASAALTCAAPSCWCRRCVQARGGQGVRWSAPRPPGRSVPRARVVQPTGRCCQRRRACRQRRRSWARRPCP